MVTLTGRFVPDIMLTGFDKTGFVPLMQLALEVSKQFTISPFTGKYVKFGLFDPVFVPFTFH